MYIKKVILLFEALITLKLTNFNEKSNVKVNVDFLSMF